MDSSEYKDNDQISVYSHIIVSNCIHKEGSGSSLIFLMLIFIADNFEPVLRASNNSVKLSEYPWWKKPLL